MDTARPRRPQTTVHRRHGTTAAKPGRTHGRTRAPTGRLHRHPLVTNGGLARFGGGAGFGRAEEAGDLFERVRRLGQERPEQVEYVCAYRVEVEPDIQAVLGGV